MKRALLIVGGTVGGLGAVLSITPPQISSSSSVSSLPGAMPALGGAKQNAPTPTAKATQSSAPTTAATKRATPSAKASAQSSASATAAPAQSQSASPTPTPTHSTTPTPAATKSGVTGTFTGSAVDVSYGIVQVKITVANGQITDAQAVQAPNGRNDRYTQMAVPILRQRTLAAQGANISGVSGASYTSYGWYTSLVSALKQAGL
ncbi:MAG: FMN-binding protein [Actinobacteria bacterium]|nr:FMN-binding protein [Actinomycetota bacterium]